MRAIAPVERDELAPALWSAGLFFCALCSFYILRPLRDAMGIAGPLRARFIGLEQIGGNYQDVRHRVPSLEKAKRLLGFEPRVRLEEGLAKTLAWHLALREEAVEVA